jgi:hypothetical protein|tara:strand:- start:5244 stop:6104 length:861 start_codon:yes stop_codon:yes gene_type:complete
MTITYQTILPDPNNPIGSAGQNTGTAGPGYASVKLTSKSPIMKTRTNSGRLVGRAIVGHSWEIGLGYNPMTRLEFEPIYNFLLQRRGGLKPFFVSLPQYRVPQDSVFAAYALANLTIVKTNLVATDVLAGNNYIIATPGNTTWTNIGAPASTSGTPFTATEVGTGTGNVQAAAGSTSLLVDGLTASNGSPSPGDLFTITDANDANHTKTYRVTQIETNTVYDDLQPQTTERIIHFIPGLQKATYNNAILNFHNPLIRVTLASDVQEYSLNTEGLYSFSLKLEEAQT